MSESLNPERSLEMLTNTLAAVRRIRSNVQAVFESIVAEPVVNINSEDREKFLRQEFQISIQAIQDNVKSIDTNLGNNNPPPNLFNLGNTNFVSQEISSERIALYPQLIDSYKWLEKIHEYSNLALPILGQNSLKRTFFNASLSAKRRRTITNSYAAPPQAVDNIIMSMVSQFKSLEIQIQRPMGSNACLVITLGRTLRGIVILKGWLIEWVVVRGWGEDMTHDDGSLDLWTESQYKVFQKVTDNANAAVLHFNTPTHPEITFRSFMHWLYSYINIFIQRCKKCNLYLNNNMPSTWRDLRSLEPYHEECKP